MLTYVDSHMDNYLPIDLGLIVEIAHKCNFDLGVGGVQIAQRDSAMWIAYMRVAESEKYLYRGSNEFYERIGTLGDCMKTIRQRVLDMQMQLGHDFTIITRRFDIGIQDNWDIVESAIHYIWDDMDVIVCEG